MQFVTIGEADAVPDGGLARFEADGTPVAVANVDGDLYAFHDSCTHAQCSLSEGELEVSDKEVVCSCHGGTFDITSGAVVDGPPPEPVATYRVRVDGGKLQVEV